MTRKAFQWYPAMNRWHDQTGIAHLLNEKSKEAVPLCGARPRTLGGGFASADEAGCVQCQKCLRIHRAQIKADRKP